MAGPLDLIKEAIKAAEKYGVPTELFLRQIYQESRFNPDAVSHAGATGIAQFMPATAEGAGIDPTDPIASLDAAAKWMSQLNERYGRWDYALAAYNAGPGNVDKYGGVPPFKETQDYVRIITQGGAEIPKSVMWDASKRKVTPSDEKRTVAIGNDEERGYNSPLGDLMAFLGGGNSGLSPQQQQALIGALGGGGLGGLGLLGGGQQGSGGVRGDRAPWDMTSPTDIFGLDGANNTALPTELLGEGGSGGPGQQNGTLDFLRGLGLSEEEVSRAIRVMFGLESNNGQTGEITPQDALASLLSGNRLALDEFLGNQRYELGAGDLELRRLLGLGGLNQQSRNDAMSNYLGAMGLGQGGQRFGLDAFSAAESAQAQRGGAEQAAGQLYSDIGNTLLSALAQQQKLGLDIATNPRNAVAGFLMGQGAEGKLPEFDVSRILGVTPDMFQNQLTAAQQAADALMTRSQQPQQVDLSEYLAGMKELTDALTSFEKPSNTPVIVGPGSGGIVDEVINAGKGSIDARTRVPKTKVTTNPKNGVEKAYTSKKQQARSKVGNRGLAI